MPKSAVIICPYFHRESEQKITCEGVVKGSTTLLKFCSEEEKRSHRRLYCQSYDYENVRLQNPEQEVRAIKHEKFILSP